ncbi:MAG TPA: DUF433 domain-containing protein [Anaerolineae bacterium]|nr:DUF433 domain-containing protein [Anaerolineae bacterium]
MIATKTLDGLIIQNSQLHGGRPVIAGTGITVRTIAIMYKQGYNPEEITSELPLTLAQVYAALTYYHLHTSEIEADIQADSEEVLIQAYNQNMNV